jgi:hypothetical protein
VVSGENANERLGGSVQLLLGFIRGNACGGFLQSFAGGGFARGRNV